MTFSLTPFREARTEEEFEELRQDAIEAAIWDMDPDVAGSDLDIEAAAEAYVNERLGLLVRTALALSEEGAA